MNDLQSFDLSDPYLIGRAGLVTFNRGVDYHESGRVNPIQIDTRYASFTVSGTRLYGVDIMAGESGLNFFCSCPQADAGNFCKHKVAAGLYLREHNQKNGLDAWRGPMKQVLDALESSSGKQHRRPYYLVFSLNFQYNGWSLHPYTLDVSRVVELTGPDFEERPGNAIIDLVRQNAWLGAQARRASQALDPDTCVNAPQDVVSLANVIQRAEAAGSGYSYYGYTRPINDYLSLLAGSDTPLFLGETNNPLKKLLRLWKEPGKVKISITRDANGVVLVSTRVNLGDSTIDLENGGAQQLASSPVWLLYDTDVFQLLPVENLGARTVFIENPSIRIPPDGETEFLETYLIPIADSLAVNGEQIRWEDIHAEPQKRLYLEEENGELVVRLFFAYEDVEVPYESDPAPATTRHKQDGTWTLLRVHRETGFEEEVYRSISGAHSGLKYLRSGKSDNGFLLRANVDVIDFLLKRIPVLLEDGFEIYGEERLTQARVNRQAPTLSLIVSSGIDWFDIQAIVRFGEIDVSLKEVRRALRKKNRYVKLADGSIGELPEEWVAKYRHLFGLGKQTDDGVRLSRYHMTLVEQLLDEAEDARSDAAFQSELRRLRDFEGIEPVSLPDGFHGELRPYQKAGYDWLHFLRTYDFGGCLADDMGLGKTVQVLAFLQSLTERADEARASLVVVPRSLLFNWQREAEKFTPGLQVLEHFGPGRSKTPKPFGQYDIVITTYGTMRRDIQMLRTYPFRYAVLDESQAIKNPNAQVSKAARLLNATHRLVMTGTPVENSTYELWSQFAFLNPGLLGGLEYFKREFANPIERGQDESAAAFLRQLVYPFILRRTKSQVAPELPPRTERVVYGEMEPAQQKLYDRTRDYYRSLVLGLIEEQGIDDTRMKILEGLLRLRQIANHPMLVEERFRGKSAKMEMLLEHLDTLQSEGHKVLVFSQFVKMLRLIEKRLQKLGLPYVYLDGKTQNRQEKVDRFQDDDSIPFFLISLRAGGVGLNLTAADYVVHVDPWWNPAVEMQATDRTHRIGQDKPVFVYKLITRDTVEEKILMLQEHKRALVDKLITTESRFFKDLTADDVRSLFS